MGIWQNIKDADYSFEKILVKTIFSITVCLLLFFLIDKLIHLSPEVLFFFQTNKNIFFGFIIIGIILFLIHYTLYFGSLDFVEAETLNTLKVAKNFRKIWLIFWICWGVFCSISSSRFNTPNLKIYLISFFLLLIPSVLLSILSEIIRNKDIKEEVDNKILFGDNFKESETYDFSTSRKFYCGYYALFCIPAYLIALLLLFLFW